MHLIPSHRLVLQIIHLRNESLRQPALSSHRLQEELPSDGAVIPSAQQCSAEDNKTLEKGSLSSHTSVFSTCFLGLEPLALKQNWFFS